MIGPLLLLVCKGLTPYFSGFQWVFFWTQYNQNISLSIYQMQKPIKEEFYSHQQPYYYHIPQGSCLQNYLFGYQPELNTPPYTTVSASQTSTPLFWGLENHLPHPYQLLGGSPYSNPGLWGQPHPHQFYQQQFIPREEEPRTIVSSQQEPEEATVKQECESQPEQSLRSSGPSESKELTKPCKKYRRINTPNYYWTLEQNRRYVQFLKNHQNLFDLSLSDKKNLKINVMMSKKVKTRNSYQCRSHHQKMIKKYATLDNLIRQMTSELNLSERPPTLLKTSTAKSPKERNRGTEDRE